jgi:hypothetical protein
MPRDFFDPTPEQQIVILIDAAILRKAERLIESCEACNEDDAQSLSITSSIGLPAPIERDGLHSGVTGEVSELPAGDPRKDAGRSDLITKSVGAGIMTQKRWFR